jgi:hypothetical protein
VTPRKKRTESDLIWFMFPLYHDMSFRERFKEHLPVPGPDNNESGSNPETLVVPLANEQADPPSPKVGLEGLWDEAYAAVNEENPKLLFAYEQLVISLEQGEHAYWQVNRRRLMYF